jgi:hypothetical protein
MWFTRFRLLKKILANTEKIMATGTDLSNAVVAIQGVLSQLQKDVSDVATALASGPANQAAIDDAVTKLTAMGTSLAKVDTDLDALTGVPNT